MSFQCKAKINVETESSTNEWQKEKRLSNVCPSTYKDRNQHEESAKFFY